MIVNYFDFNAATNALSTASISIGGCIAGLNFGKVTDIMGRCPAMFWYAVIGGTADHLPEYRHVRAWGLGVFNDLYFIGM
jgi:hypothetical protein